MYIIHKIDKCNVYYSCVHLQLLPHTERAYVNNSSFKMETNPCSNNKHPCYLMILVIPNRFEGVTLKYIFMKHQVQG